MKIKCTCFAEAYDNLDFKSEEGEHIKMDRTRVYVQPDGARYPESILIVGNYPLGEYTGFIDLASKKDKLVVSLDVDSLQLVKPAPKAAAA